MPVEVSEAIETNTHLRFASQSPDACDEAATSEDGSCSGQSDRKRWGLILAGGDGMRLRSLTRLISGDDRPKQFCNVIGRDTLFEQTRRRAAQSIPAHRTIIALTASHKKYYQRCLGSSLSCRLVQPRNLGTAPPIILSLLYIASRAPDAVVAVLPSDHYYSDEVAFHATLESAFRLAGEHQHSVILLGAPPRGPEVELGWIKLGATVGESAYRVRGFEEKPAIEIALQLFASGSLWNTFVMVGNVSAFLWMSFVSLPQLFTTLSDSLPLHDEDGDLRVPDNLYEAITTADFSRRVLSLNARSLLALRLHQVEWHDLGCPDRVVSAVCAQGQRFPSWMSKLGRGRQAGPTQSSLPSI